MRRAVLVVVLGLGFVFSTLAAQDKQSKQEKKEPEKKTEVDKKKLDAVKKEKQKLIGTWEVVDWVNNGEPLPQEQVKLMQVQFTQDEMFMSLPKATGKREYTYKIDPTQKPKTIDTTPNLTKVKVKANTAGIYEFEEETLKLCLASFGSGLRPKEFESKAGTGRVLITLKRAKK